jgi:hypothetical protein
MVDNSGFVGGSGGKVLILPKVEGRTGGASADTGERTSNASYMGITGYGAMRGLTIPLFLPKITNSARDFTTTGNLTYGYAPASVNGYKPNIYEQSFKNFTIDTGHQITIREETIAIIRASETITIGGNGVTAVGQSNSGCFLAYPYDHATTAGNNSNATNKAGGGGGSSGNGGGQPQRATNTSGSSNGGQGGGKSGTNIRSALVLIADTITINGNITFNGGDAPTPGSTSAGKGGGHGGYVYLIANTINYNGGTINVSGGNGTNGGAADNTGGGGGGHCGIVYTHAKTYSGSSTTITATVGTAGAGNGTGGDGSDGGYPYPTMSTGEYKIEGSPF